MDADAPTVPSVRRPQALEAGLFLLVVVLPIAFFPLSRRGFLEIKLLVLSVGTLLVLISGVAADRRLARPALAWAGVMAAAAALGVDPEESLIGSVRATGLVLVMCTAALVAVGPNVPTELWERARGWLVWTGVAVAVVMVTARMAPEITGVLGSDLRFAGSTFGNPVFAVGFLACSIPAALAGRYRAWQAIAIFATYGAGFAVAEERSAWLLPIAALGASAWFLRPAARRLGLAAATIGVMVLLWTFVPALADHGGPTDRYTTVGQFQTLAGERQRLALAGANLRAFADRPVLGWGPANGWTGFLSAGTPTQIEQAGRNWSDAHNLVLEVAVTSGLIGLAAFLWLLARLIPRAARPIPKRRWLAAAAATLGVYAMFEPMDVTLTPLLLLFAGAAAGVVRAEAVTQPRRARTFRPLAAAGIAGVTVLAGLNLSASALEQWGATHGDSDWALRAAVRLAPWSLSARESLAKSLALAARAGSTSARTEARSVVAALVMDHPMNPGVRLLAADIELLLGHLPGSQGWIREQLEVFPNDIVSVPAAQPAIGPPA